jgi:uncharacterized protein
MRAPILFAGLLAVIAASRYTVIDSPIADAAMRGDTAAVRSLIKRHGDVNAPQGDGTTALHWAASQGNVDEIKLLLGAGAKVDAGTRNGSYTPLHFAAREGRTAAIKALIRVGANVNATTTTGGATPLHFAAGEGDPDAVAALLDAKANVNARDSAFQQTPVMWAAAANRVRAIEVLVAHGADLKATSKVEHVAQKEAADRAATQKKRAANPDLPAYLLAGGGRGGGGRGAGGGGRGAAQPGTPATPRPSDSSAAKLDTTSSVVGADGRPITGFGGAGGGAGGGGRIGRGDDLYGSKGGLTPLLFAAREGNVEAAQALLKAGADVNEVSAGDHSSPLLIATINGQFDLAEVLLKAGANPKLAADNGATPLYATLNVQWAPKSLYPQPTAQLQQKTEYLTLMEDLLKAGADPNARLTKHLWYMSYNFDLLGVNTAGATPFWRAAYGTDVPAMKLLVKYGAKPNEAYTIKTAGRLAGADAPVESDTTKDPSGLPPVPNGGPGVFAIHAASGVGYGEGYAANSHMHAPDGWMPSIKYLVEELHMDVNQRDQNGYTALHHAAARGDNEMIQYLVAHGADVTVVSRRGQTVVDMANGPVQRVSPFPETIELLEKLGAKNSHKCKSCSP